MIRTSLLAGFATLALFAAPAMAQNVSNISNTAAGVGNVAVQDVTTLQKARGGFAGPNLSSVSNTAAGIGNYAGQSALVMQKSKGLFGAPNLAAGHDNFAGRGRDNFAGRGAFVKQRYQR